MVHTIHISVTISFPVLEFYVKGIIQYVFLCVCFWFLFLSRLLKPIHVGIFISLFSYCFKVWMNIPSFLQSDELLFVFKVFGYIQAFLYISLGRHIYAWLWNLYLRLTYTGCMFSFATYCQFPKWLNPFVLRRAMSEIPSSHILSAFAIFYHF